MITCCVETANTVRQNLLVMFHQEAGAMHFLKKDRGIHPHLNTVNPKCPLKVNREFVNK